MENESYVGKKFYFFFESSGVVEFEVLSKNEIKNAYHTKTVFSDDKLVTEEALLEGSPTPEEAKVKWYKERHKEIQNKMKSLENNLKRIRKAVDYGSLKQEHPELFL